jgi:hypothetical protein
MVVDELDHRERLVVAVPIEVACVKVWSQIFRKR